MSAFIHDDFLLESPQARRLYHDHAAAEPIYDYHTHLPVDQIANDHRFADLTEIWLGGDHYKWRAMRANGIAESRITGDTDSRDKFDAWAATLPHTLRNPLYHWSQLELKRYFGIDTLLGPDTADQVWQQANEQLADPSFSTRNLLRRGNVRLVCSTDDPCDPLKHHDELARDPDSPCAVYPTFRPDRALQIERINSWRSYLDQLTQAAGIDCSNLSRFKDALHQRHGYFHQHGCRLSDHGLGCLPLESCAESDAARIFDRARNQQDLTAGDGERFASHMMQFFGELNAGKGWTMQLHLGALRNANTRLFKRLGRDIGCDSIAELPQIHGLVRFLDDLDAHDQLPKVVLYNLNPGQNRALVAALGNFQREIPGKLQYGSAWWFLDTEEGMTDQINALSSIGLLSHFVGMLTDSRSFLSAPRHEYFRRILCNLLGRDMQRGALPDDLELVGSLVSRICYRNAVDYFGMKLRGDAPAPDAR